MGRRDLLQTRLFIDPGYDLDSRRSSALADRLRIKPTDAPSTVACRWRDRRWPLRRTDGTHRDHTKPATGITTRRRCRADGRPLVRRTAVAGRARAPLFRRRGSPPRHDRRSRTSRRRVKWISCSSRRWYPRTSTSDRSLSCGLIETRSERYGQTNDLTEGGMKEDYDRRHG